MTDLKYFKEEGRFLESAWDVYRDYFVSRSNFLYQYNTIPSAERKNLFLMILSGYKLLVRDGQYRLVEEWQHLYLDYLDNTYKFISIMSLIEALFADEPHVDFYQWLTMKKRRKQIFPITDPETLDELYREYKIKFGARKAIRFFSQLDESAQSYLAARIKIDNDHKPAEAVRVRASGATGIGIQRWGHVLQARGERDVFNALHQGSAVVIRARHSAPFLHDARP